MVLLYIFKCSRAGGHAPLLSDKPRRAKGGAMSVILLSELSLADGEYAVARIWLALEEYCVASPRMAVAAHGYGLIDIYLAFGSTEDAELVRYALPSLPPIAGSDAAPERAG